MNELVSIVIVNWNGKKNLKECLESLFKISYRNYEVIIVDNGSKDGSQSYIKKIQRKRKNVILVENSENLGFAEGNNVGYEEAKGELILLLNNDTLVEPEFLSVLVGKMKTSKIGAVQPKILMYPKKNFVDSAGSYFNNSGFLYHFGHNKPDQEKYNKESEIFSMKGACMLFKKIAIEKAGGLFDPSYFAYFEETDLCQRIWMSGHEILYIPNSKIYHKGGETAKHLNSEFVQFNSYKNRIFTYLKNFELKTILKVLPIHLIFCQLVVVVYILTFRFKISFAIEKAMLWNFFNIFSIFRKRNKIRGVVRDSDYLPKLTRSVRPSYYFHLFATSLAGYKD